MFRDSQISFFKKSVTKTSVFHRFVTIHFFLMLHSYCFFIISVKDCHETFEVPLFRDRFASNQYKYCHETSKTSLFRDRFQNDHYVIVTKRFSGHCFVTVFRTGPAAGAKKSDPSHMGNVEQNCEKTRRPVRITQNTKFCLQKQKVCI